MTDFIVKARKFVAALAAAVAIIVANGLLAGDAAKWTNGVIAAVGAFLVYLVPNGDVVAKETLSGEVVAAEASPLPDNTPVEVVPSGTGTPTAGEQGEGV